MTALRVIEGGLSQGSDPEQGFGQEPSMEEAGPKRRGAHLFEHGEPLLEGPASRRHAFYPMGRWRRRAFVSQLTEPFRLRELRSFLQFAGFPRSGHSLIGSLIDAHPDAAVAHELDAMGLFRKGLAPGPIARLALRNSEAFLRDGRWWNGYRYEVPEGEHGRSGAPALIGDKKGDWATRWCSVEPSLLDRFREQSPWRIKWVLVTRHPFDNVATMSLRKGGVYDRLRIEEEPEHFKERLQDAQDAGDIPREVLGEMVQDYRALASAVAEMKRRTPKEDWFELAIEDFVRSPAEYLIALARFLGLREDGGWARACAAIVREGKSRSRDSLRWQPEQQAALSAAIEARDFLSAYRDRP